MMRVGSGAKGGTRRAVAAALASGGNLPAVATRSVSGCTISGAASVGRGSRRCRSTLSTVTLSRACEEQRMHQKVRQQQRKAAQVPGRRSQSSTAFKIPSTNRATTATSKHLKHHSTAAGTIESSSYSSKEVAGAGSVGAAATINRINDHTHVREQKLSEGTLYMGFDSGATPELPGNGGLRIGTYDSPDAAQDEAVALTEAMSAKHGMYNTGFTGAKLVFDSDVAIPDLCKDTLMKEVADSLGAMKGSVYTGCDMNTTHKDMVALDDMSPYVLAGIGSPIDTNVATAAGAFAAVVRTAEHLGLPRTFRVHVQGTGNVGSDLANRLVDYGATVYTSDIIPSKADVPGCTNVSGTNWESLDVDIFSPNGAAGVITKDVVTEMRCKAIAGAANVPFQFDADRVAASAKGIIIVPDHVASAGAIIIDSLEWNSDEYQSLRPSRAYAFIIDQISAKVGDYLALVADTPVKNRCVDHMADSVASVGTAGRGGYSSNNSSNENHTVRANNSSSGAMSSSSSSSSRASRPSKACQATKKSIVSPASANFRSAGASRVGSTSASGSGSKSSGGTITMRNKSSSRGSEPVNKGVIGSRMERWAEESAVRKDVVVIGAGMAGTAAAYQLSKLAPQVAGVVLEAGEEVAHKGGSSYGTSRMFRQMYSDPYFSDLQTKSLSLWKELEEESATTLLDVNGLLFYGEADTGETVEGSIPGALDVMQKRKIPHQFFDNPSQMAERFPPMKPEPKHIGLYEETAGSVNSSLACESMMSEAQKGGNWDLEVSTKVVDIWQGDGDTGYHVTTSDGQNFTAEKLVLCPGAWGNDLLAHFDLKLDMQVWGVHWGHYGLKDGAKPSQWFHFGKDDALFYGFPVDKKSSPSSAALGRSADVGDTTVVGKVGADFSPERNHYETMDSFEYEADSGVQKQMSDFLAKQWGDLYTEEVDMMSSPYAMTKDAMFVLDTLPDHPNVSIFTAGNGRAFKFAPMLGKALADLTLGQEPSFDVSRMAITRPGLLLNSSGSHDVAYGRAHVPYGDEGAATYSKITLGCFDVVMKAKDMIEDSIRALRLPKDSTNTVRIADFGSADGGPLMPMVNHVRGIIPEGCDLEVGFEDQPNNDFKSLFYLANGTEQVPVECPPLTSTPGIYYHAVGRSFFEQCFPRGSVDLAMSYTALHWMSELPCTILDHVHHTGTGNLAAQEQYAAQAAKDWKEILTHRAAELKPGGQMVISTLAKDPEGHYLGWNGEEGFANMFGELNSCWMEMKKEGRITQKEYEEASFVNYYRDEAELLAPFEGSSGSAATPGSTVPGLRVKKLEWRKQICPFGRGKGTPLSVVLTVRSWSNSTFLSALDANKRSPEERAALVDELYGRYEGRIAADPMHHAMDYVHAYIHFEKERE